jgi:hypothetical protein
VTVNVATRLVPKQARMRITWDECPGRPDFAAEMF